MTTSPHKRNETLWCVLHQSVLESDLADSTKALYLSRLDTFTEALGTQPAGWTKERMHTFYKQLCDKNKPQSVKVLVNAVRFAVDYYNQQTYGAKIDDDFVRFRLAKPREENEREFITEDEARALLETCFTKTPADLRDFAMIVVMAETGWREISVVNALWERIKEIEPNLTIIKVRSKGEDNLPVPLSPTVLQSFSLWKAWCASRGIQNGPIFRSLVFRGKELQVGDRPMSTQAVYDIVVKRGKEAGIPRHIHPHLMRHAYATWRSGELIPPSVIQSITGHKDPGFSDAAKGYVNLRPLWRQAIKTTPPWLVELVDRFLR